MTTTINYVDTFPGIGKTYWAKKELIRRIRERDGVTIYVGPTLALLSEVERSLKRELNAVQQTRVRMLHSRYSPDVPHVTMQIAQSLALNAPSPRNAHTRMRVMAEGSVILCTHEAFYRLPMSLTDRARTRIIFDEAKKCVSPMMRVTVSSGKKFMACLSLKPVDDSNYHMVVRTKDEVTLRSMLVRHPQFSSFLMKTLSQDYGHRLYLRCDGNAITAYAMLMPGRVLSGWRDVYLMSAYLMNSQMWSLLLRSAFEYKGKVCTMQKTGKSSNFNGYQPVPVHTATRPAIRLVNATNDLIRNHNLRTDVLREKYSQIEIVYLTANETTPSKRKMQSVLIPRDRVEDAAKSYRQLLDKFKVPSRRAMPAMLADMAGKSDHIEGLHDRDLLAAFQDWTNTLPEEAQLNPLGWMVRTSLSIYSKWRDEKKLRPKQLLVACNKSDKEHLTLSGMAHDLELLPSHPHGQNAYIEHDAVLFMSAINPTVWTRNFFNAVIPWYTFGVDYEGDAAIQAVTRCSIRDLSHNRPALIIVPDERVALGLCEMLQGVPTIRSATDYGKPELVSMHVYGGSDPTSELRKKKYRTQRHVRDQERAYSKTFREHAKQSPHYKKLASVRTMMSRARKAFDAARAKALTPRLAELTKLHEEWLKEHPFVRQ